MAIDGCEKISAAIKIYGEDPELLDEFLLKLVEGRVLTLREARLRLGSSQLNKLRKIGKYANALRRPDILPYLVSGYSVIYQACILLEQKLEGDEAQRTAGLAQILQRCPANEDISRGYLIDTGKLLDASKRALASMSADDSRPEAAARSAKVLALGERFDLLVITPTDKDIALLRRDYVDGSLERALQLYQRMDANAAAVIILPVLDALVLANRLLHLAGFHRPTSASLVRHPIFPKVSDAQFIITAERGEMPISSADDLAWLDDGAELDARAIAERLYPTASRKLHAFAATKRDGWTCLVGDQENWVEKPSIK